MYILSWILTWFPQILIFIPNRYRSQFRFLGVSVFCFCILNTTREQFARDPTMQRIAKHEFRHQWQQRILSPLLLGILYFGEWGFRILLMKQSMDEAYNQLFWERDANAYMRRFNNKT